MKTKYGYFFAAFAVIISLASCSLEIIEPETGTGSATDGMRVITLAYAESTKAELSGLQPVFKAGDVIKVSNGSESEDCTVFLDSRSNPVIKTALRGVLTAVYPASAAAMTGNGITGVNVPAAQSGKFSEAIIAKADNVDNTARFVPQTALLRFYVGGEIEVQSFMVASSSGDVATGSNVVIVSESFTSSSLTNHLYSRNWSPMDPRICYMAVNAGVNAGNLTFTGVTLSQGTVSKKCTVNVTLEAGHLYDAFLPYYVDMGSGGKWSYCNIGAFLPEDYGEYFMWGEVKGHKPSGTGSYAFSDFLTFDHSDSRYPAGFVANNGFSTSNTPFYIGPSDADWSKYNNTDYSTTVILEAADDAATVNWGGSWRMPTKSEYDNLLNNCPDQSETVEHDVNVVRIAYTVYKYLYFPKAGYGSSRDLSYPGTEYGYWTSTQSDGNPRAAYYFKKFDDYFPTYYRRMGLSIRPVSDGAGQPALFSVWSNKKVQFTKGNLYWDGSSGSYKMESNQYDYRNYNGKTGDKAVINGVETTTPANTVGSFWWVKNGETNFNPYDATYGTPSTGGDFRYEYLFTNMDDDVACNTFTVNGETGKYRTLSSIEWEYLLGTRSSGTQRTGNLFAIARVKGIVGLLVFPDDYAAVPSDDGIAQINKWYDVTIPTVSVADHNWKYLESTGVVFLPAAGRRESTKVVNTGNTMIEYWCSGHNNAENVNCLWFPPDNSYDKVCLSASPKYGRPIRLVYDAN